MFDFFSLKKTLADVGDHARQLHQQIETLKRQREDTINAPSTRDDVKEMATKWAAGRSAEYVKRLQFNMQEFVTDPTNLQNAQAIDSRMTLFGKSRQMGTLGMFPGPELDDMAICCLMGPSLVKALHAAIDAMENWPEGSTPMNGRDKKISDLDGQLEKLIRQEAALVREAQEAGIQIS